MYRKQRNHDQQVPEQANSRPAAPKPCSLDDDPELAHIARFSPPEIEVGPDSDSRAGRDMPPPMIRPAHAPSQEGDGSQDGEAGSVRKIEHIAPLGPLAERESAEEAVAPAAPGPKKKIRAFDQKLGGAAHEDSWNRTPNVTGTGAIHVKSFHCKLTGDSLEFLDMQINEWLDAHPQYEVKQVTTSVGDWSGKTREPALIVNVWV